MSEKKSITSSIAESLETVAEEHQMDAVQMLTYTLSFAIQYLIHVSDNKDSAREYLEQIVDKSFNLDHKERTLH